MGTKGTPGRRRGVYSQTARVLAVLALVRGEEEPVFLSRIAATLSVSERQARRDVAVLVEAGLGVSSVIVDGRSALVCDDERLVRTTGRTRMLVASLAGFASQLGPGSVGEELRAALSELSSGGRTERAEPCTLVAAPTPMASALIGERVDRVERAIRDRHELRVQLAGEGDEGRALAFLPYALALHPGGPHVVGRWEPGEPLRAIPIERFVHLEVALGTVVAAPEKLDLAGAFEAARATAPRPAHP